MCTSLFLWDQHPTLLFLLVFNRDEFFSRQTTPAHFWHDAPFLLAGRDAERGGTWLGVTTGGRFAMLTNFREAAYDQIKNAPSRGDLTTQFLLSKAQPLQYLKNLNAQAYNGFNLIVGDFPSRSLAYLSNRQTAGQEPRELPPGLYGISNGLLDSKWPKVEQGKTQLQALLNSNAGAEQIDAQTVFEAVMNQKSKEQDVEQLPKTGLPVEIEQLMSSIFITPCNLKGAAYGTRSQTFLSVRRDGQGELHERSRPAQAEHYDPETCEDVLWTEVHEQFCWPAPLPEQQQTSN